MESDGDEKRDYDVVSKGRGGYGAIGKGEKWNCECQFIYQLQTRTRAQNMTHSIYLRQGRRQYCGEGRERNREKR